jgi:putative ABC transport system permease protein
MKRAKEVAMRKVIGAGRMELVKQFLTESVVMALLALPLALLMYAITFPMMTAYMGQSKDIPLWNHPFLFKYLLGLTVLVGIFAGSYPAFILSAFKPEKVLKKEMTSGKKGSRLRKILVVSQFSLAIFLIMWTMLFKKQFDHFMAVDFGYDRSRVLAVSFKNVPPDTLEVLKKELGRYPGMISVAAASGLPGSWGPEQNVIPEGMDENRGWMVNAYGVDFGFVETVGIKMAQGRSFSRAFNDKNSLIINETLVRRIGWTQPLGRRITIGGEKRTVVGVAGDFQFRSAHFGLAPAVLYLESKEINWLLLKFSADQRFAVVLDHIKKTWNEFVVDYPFEWITLDDYFHDIYSWMEKVFYIMRILNTIIVFVAALSLFGLVSYSVERRTKEIGIRKVLGASVPGIIRLLSGEFVLLVILANLLAIPVSAWVTQRLMRIQISFSLVRLDFGMCALTIVMTLAATILAISWQIWRAARANPAESLHYE